MQEQEVITQIVEVIATWGLRVAGAIAILVIGWVLSRWVRRQVLKRAGASERIDETVSQVLGRLAGVSVLVITLIAVLGQFGVQTTSLVALLGAAGLAIGLALQGTLGNVSSGVMLLLLRPFGVGDRVEVAGTLGIVDEISLFVTHLHTPDNVYVEMPNSEIWGNEIRNYSRNDTRRIDMVFGISYDDDMDKAIRVIGEVLEAEERVLRDPAPVMVVGELGDSSVNIYARPWVKTPDYRPTKWALTQRVKARFDEVGLEMPYPQRDVHLFRASKAGETAAADD